MSRILDQALAVARVVQGVDITKLCFAQRRPEYPFFEVRDADILIIRSQDWEFVKQEYHRYSDLFNDEHPIYLKIWGLNS